VFVRVAAELSPDQLGVEVVASGVEVVFTGGVELLHAVVVVAAVVEAGGWVAEELVLFAVIVAVVEAEAGGWVAEEVVLFAVVVAVVEAGV
jgi:hypothetical protein